MSAPICSTRTSHLQHEMQSSCYRLAATGVAGLHACLKALASTPRVHATNRALFHQQLGNSQILLQSKDPVKPPLISLHCLAVALGWSGMQSNWSETDPGPRLAALPLPKLCPVGFVFIWAEKEHISAVIKQVIHLL